eukprot:2412003-Pyramimonas_sp.AAC.1
MGAVNILLAQRWFATNCAARVRTPNHAPFGPRAELCRLGLQTTRLSRCARLRPKCAVTYRRPKLLRVQVRELALALLPAIEIRSLLRADFDVACE